MVIEGAHHRPSGRAIAGAVGKCNCDRAQDERGDDVFHDILLLCCKQREVPPVAVLRRTITAAQPSRPMSLKTIEPS